jgi:V8-like Glu-specific endopeptidase
LYLFVNSCTYLYCSDPQPLTASKVRLSFADGALYLADSSSSSSSVATEESGSAASFKRQTLQQQKAPAGRRHLRGISSLAPAATAEQIAEQQTLAAIGQLTVGGAWACTATLIAPGVILTAAHCVFDRGDDSGRPVAPKQLTFTPGRHIPAGADGSEDPFGSSDVEHCTFSRNFLPDITDVTTKWSHDVAVCELKDKAMGAETGFMGVGVTEDAWTSDIKHAGYPDVTGTPAGSLRVTECTVSVTAEAAAAAAAGEAVVPHSCGSDQGESGAPLYDPATKQVRAVAVYEVEGEYNAATLITENLWSSLIQPSLVVV